MDATQHLKEMKQAYIDTFTTEKGKRVLRDLNRYRYKTTFRLDPIEMAYREGQRSLVLHIENMIRLDYEKLQEQVKTQEEN